MWRQPDPRSRGARYRPRYPAQQAEEVWLEQEQRCCRRSLNCMKLLQLVPVGECDIRNIEALGPALSQHFGLPWDALPGSLNPDFAYHAERQQYHSTDILGRLQSLAAEETWRLLGVTGLDLYIPILTFVFGEAQMNGQVAVVSSHRLRQELY